LLTPSVCQTEEDFAQIAGAGLNWIRLPIPFWAIDTWPGEPFLPKVSWKYALKAFGWARKYGIRIMLDIHSTPGSQNGYGFHSDMFVGVIDDCLFVKV
jgi:aryl-phospho-beta-D-glucosidase BglC (GH1 family)